MNERDFAYWLNGFVEMNGGAMPTAAQWKAIQDHLALVFKKVTPPVAPSVQHPAPGIDWDEVARKYRESQPTPPNWWTPGHILPGTIIC